MDAQPHFIVINDQEPAPHSPSNNLQSLNSPPQLPNTIATSQSTPNALQQPDDHVPVHQDHMMLDDDDTPDLGQLSFQDNDDPNEHPLPEQLDDHMSDCDDLLQTFQLEDHSPWNDLTRSLHDWATQNRVSNIGMTRLMSALRDAGLDDKYYLPNKWSSVQIAQARHDEDELGADAVVGVSKVLEFCTACWLHKFTPEEIEDDGSKCSTCRVTVVTCGYHRCREKCIVLSKMGKRSAYSLALCPQCDVSKLTTKTGRVYLFDLDTYIMQFFGDKDQCIDALQPFKGLFSLNDNEFEQADGWYEAWVRKMEEMLYQSEVWHGRRFFQHPIWTKSNSMRSLLMNVFFDNFPPFKQKYSYTIGLLSTSVLNLSNEKRAARWQSWPLAIVEGPSGIKRTYAALREVMEQFDVAYHHGVEVFDALTNKAIKVRACLTLVIADSPANAKLGEHKSSAAYYGCHRCGHQAVPCGHLTRQDDPDPPRYDHFEARPSAIPPTHRVLLSGEPRPKSKNEHLVWLDSKVLTRHHLQSNLLHTVQQHSVWARLMDEDLEWTKTQLKEWIDKKRSNSMSPLQHVPHFNLIEDMPADPMHFIIKGICQDLAEYTLSDANKKAHGNINKSAHTKNAFKQRLQSFALPQGVNAHQGLTKNHINYSKADALYDFVRVQALICFEGLLPHGHSRVWYLMCTLVCGILHTHIPKEWITNSLPFLVTDLIETYKREFGECSLCPNWHQLLHLCIDFDNWSTPRSHWAFPGERLCGNLIKQVRNNSWSRVTQTVVNNIPRVTSRFTSEHDRESLRSDVHRPTHNDNDLSPSELAQIGALVASGHRFVKTTTAPHNHTWHVGDLLFCCTFPKPPNAKVLFKIATILRLDNDRSSQLVLRVLAGITRRPGYNNAYHWPDSNAFEDGPLFILKCWCPRRNAHVCGVAVFAESFIPSPLLIPTCGELPFMTNPED